LLFDGHYLYIAQFTLGNPVYRIDTTISTLHVPCTECIAPTVTSTSEQIGGHAGTFDGRYIYLVGSVILQYDTRSAFQTTSSWKALDMSVLGISGSFGSAVFDGRFVYMTPLDATVIVRYDTRGPFTATGSWNMVTTAMTTSLSAGAFDGRNIYFAPGTTATNAVKYDTTKPFIPSSIEAVWGITPALSGTGSDPQFSGVVFDGSAVYFIPFTESSLVSVKVGAPTPPVPSSNIGHAGVEAVLLALSWPADKDSVLLMYLSLSDQSGMDLRYWFALNNSPGVSGNAITVLASISTVTSTSSFNTNSADPSNFFLHFDGLILKIRGTCANVCTATWRTISVGSSYADWIDGTP